MTNGSAEFVLFEEFSEDMKGVGGVDVGVHRVRIGSEDFVSGWVDSIFLEFVAYI